MAETRQRETTVSFFTIPEGHRPPQSALWVLAAYSVCIALGILLLKKLGLSGSGSSGALVALGTFLPLLVAAYFARCTCTVTSTALVFKPEGVFGPADATPLADILATRILPGPLLELDLHSGTVKRIGPWKTLTSLKSLDHRERKCRALLHAIARATSIAGVRPPP